jgi:hypothetical protein
VRAAATTTSTPTVSYKNTVAEVPRGETYGAVLVLEEVSIQAGDRDLMLVRFVLLQRKTWTALGLCILCSWASERAQVQLQAKECTS